MNSKFHVEFRVPSTGGGHHRHRTRRDRPVRVIYSRVNHNRHERAVSVGWKWQVPASIGCTCVFFSFFFPSSSLFVFSVLSSLVLVLSRLLLLLASATTTDEQIEARSVATERELLTERPRRIERDADSSGARGGGTRATWKGRYSRGAITDDTYAGNLAAFAQLLEHLMSVINGGICPERC